MLQAEVTVGTAARQQFLARVADPGGCGSRRGGQVGERLRCRSNGEVLDVGEMQVDRGRRDTDPAGDPAQGQLFAGSGLGQLVTESNLSFRVPARVAADMRASGCPGLGQRWCPEQLICRRGVG
jgi:hypothetical protein